MARPTGRNSAGHFTPIGIHAHLTGDTNMANVIATEDAIVHDDQLGIDRKVFAGQPIPPDLVDAYQDQVGTGEVRDTTATDQTGAALGTGTSTGTAPADTSSSEQLTGDALQNRAKELDIEGRSSMTADDLRDAIARAEASA